jgi:L-ascorbate metabolism protein UlaG (beta-lactamase superfamily)
MFSVFNTLLIRLVGVVLLTSTALLTSCSFTQKSEPSPIYQNRYSKTGNGEGFWRWKWEQWTQPNRQAPKQPIKGIEPNLKLIQATTDAVRLTWVGHSTLLVQVAGLNVLTDPQWSDYASPIQGLGPKRHQKPGVPFESLPPIDYVLISHNHYDHLDLETVRRLMQRGAGRVKFLVPAGIQHWFAQHVPGSALGGSQQNVFAFNWDQNFSVSTAKGPVTFRFLAVQHWSSRSPFDRYETLWGSWAVLAPHFKFWFSGDLGYSPDLLDVHKSIGDVDVAAITIGAYAPRWFMKNSHMDPDEAVQTLLDVKAKSGIGIHWGTFEGLTDEPLDEPPEKLKASLMQRQLPLERFQVLKHGQTVTWDAGRLH